MGVGDAQHWCSFVCLNINKSFINSFSMREKDQTCFQAFSEGLVEYLIFTFV